ncbi:MAG: PfkB family carbohydrate kinase, partial [Acidimicrobiia bacterium]
AGPCGGNRCAMTERPAVSAAVLAPDLGLAVTFEARPDGSDEAHVHVGGQAYWIARMLAELDVATTVVATLGGEAGTAVGALLGSGPFAAVRVVGTEGANGVYVHDRRDGDRTEVAQVRGAPLDRHATDDLYGAMVTSSLDATVAVLGGPADGGLVPDELYERLTVELKGLGCTVVADLSGPPLGALLRGGPDLVKVSDEELCRERLADGGDDAEVRAGIERLQARGAASVIVTRSGGRSTLASLGGRLFRVTGPVLLTTDDRGVGDSLTGAVAAALAGGDEPRRALQIGAAAAALNATRRGAGSGVGADVRALADHVEVVAEPSGA